MKKKFLFIFLIFTVKVFSQAILTPLEKNSYTALTSYSEISSFVEKIDSLYDWVKVEVIDKTEEDRNLYSVKFSSSMFGNDSSKIKLLLFAQQHGNEQSGKEGMLLLIKELLQPENYFLFDKIDLIIIPQINPDGSEKDKRKNANDFDLNRDHLILSQKETRSLHNLFNEILPEVTLDIHEYYPYSSEWNEYGYIKNFDEQIGVVSNPNIDSTILKFSRGVILPNIFNEVNELNISTHEYIVGGPPEINRIRYSTTDIDDGRNSFGIMGTFSFILEGKNGKTSLDNIKNRAENQSKTVLSFLKVIRTNYFDIKKIVRKSRKNLLSIKEKFSTIRMDYFSDGSNLELRLKSVIHQKDSTVNVKLFHPNVKKLLIVEKPKGYLIEKTNEQIIEFLTKHNIYFENYLYNDSTKIIQYKIIEKKESIEEERNNLYPTIKTEVVENLFEENYFFVPLNQLQSERIVTAFEPQSMIGLIQYPDYVNSLIENENFQIYRVE